MNPQTGQLDQDAVNLAKAIRQVESGGNFNARGGSGEFGAYQYTPGTWSSDSQKFLGAPIPLEQATPQQQNEVAYKKIKLLKDSGHNVGAIASIWNSGKPDAYLQDFRGTNSYGVQYDVPAYAKKVATAYQSMKGSRPAVQQATQQAAQPQQEEYRSSGEKPEEGYSVGGFLGNVLKSGAGVVKGLADAVVHPVRTVKGLGDIAQGGIELLLPGEQGHEEQAKAVGQFFADRYGGLDKVKNSFYNDPVGVLLDLSTVFSGGAGAAGAVSKASKLAGFTELATDASRVAGVASKAARATDPLAAAGRMVRGAATVGKDAAAQAAGFSSGVGGEAVRTAYQAGREGGELMDDFTAALRGSKSPEEVLSTAQSAIQDLRNTRRQEYLSQFGEALKGKIGKLPFEEVQNELRKQIANFKIKIRPDGLDFSRSTLADRTAQGVVQSIWDDVAKWDDLTPEGLDTLKRRLDDYYTPNGNARAMAQAMKNKVKDILNRNVKGYEEMTKGYEEASNALKEAQAALGGPRQTQEQALRKIRSIFRPSQRERLSTTESLEAKTGRNIKGQVAGLVMSEWEPQGLTSNLLAKGGGLLAATQAPGLLPGLVAASPRAVAETARLLGISVRKLEAALAVLEKMGIARPEALKILAQQGRLSEASTVSSNETSQPLQ